MEPFGNANKHLYPSEIKETEMRKLLYIAFVAVTALSSCGKTESSPADFAELYYNSLIAGDAQKFAEGMYSYSRVTPELRKEKVIIAKQYASVQEEQHKGIKSVEIMNDSVFADGINADVFLSINYGDSTKETILVPMVKDGDKWKMK